MTSTPSADDAKMWFEAEIDRDLAVLFQRIVLIHAHIGRTRRAELVTRLESAIPGPAPRIGIARADSRLTAISRRVEPDSRRQDARPCRPGGVLST